MRERNDVDAGADSVVEEGFTIVFSLFFHRVCVCWACFCSVFAVCFYNCIVYHNNSSGLSIFFEFGRGVQMSEGFSYINM